MSRDDWYRTGDWSASEQERFFTKLSRAHGNNSKAQYSAIKALYLVEAHKYQSAIDLLQRTLAEWPPTYDHEMNRIYNAFGDAYYGVGDVSQASEFYKKPISEKIARPNTWSYAKMIIELGRVDLYSEIQDYATIQYDDQKLAMPYDLFMYHTVRAITYDQAGERVIARENAMKALEYAQLKKSFLSRHPSIGLVSGEKSMMIIEKLKDIASS